MGERLASCELCHPPGDRAGLCAKPWEQTSQQQPFVVSSHSLHAPAYVPALTPPHKTDYDLEINLCLFHVGFCQCVGVTASNSHHITHWRNWAESKWPKERMFIIKSNVSHGESWMAYKRLSVVLKFTETWKSRQIKWEKWFLFIRSAFIGHRQ